MGHLAIRPKSKLCFIPAAIAVGDESLSSHKTTKLDSLDDWVRTAADLQCALAKYHFSESDHLTSAEVSFLLGLASGTWLADSVYVPGIFRGSSRVIDLR